MVEHRPNLGLSRPAVATPYRLEISVKSHEGTLLVTAGLTGASGQRISADFWPKREQLIERSIDPKQFGGFIASQLFQRRELGREWYHTLRTPNNALIEVTLSIETDDDQIYNLPWEAIFEPLEAGRRGLPLVLLPQVQVSRRTRPPQHRRPPHQPRRVPRVLVVIADPAKTNTYSLPPIDVQAELAAANEAFRGALIHVLASRSAERPTVAALTRALNRGEGFDILYLVCHGKLRADTALYLEGESGATAPITADTLIESMGTVRRLPSLIVLAACHGADAPALQPSLADRLAEHGVAAVLAMRGSASTHAVQRCVRALGEGLILHGLPLTEALRQARAELWSHKDYSAALQPVLYRSHDLRLPNDSLARWLRRLVADQKLQQPALRRYLATTLFEQGFGLAPEDPAGLLPALEVACLKQPTLITTLQKALEGHQVGLAETTTEALARLARRIDEEALHRAYIRTLYRHQITSHAHRPGDAATYVRLLAGYPLQEARRPGPLFSFALDLRRDAAGEIDSWIERACAELGWQAEDVQRSRETLDPKDEPLYLGVQLTPLALAGPDPGYELQAHLWSPSRQSVNLFDIPLRRERLSRLGIWFDDLFDKVSPVAELHRELIVEINVQFQDLTRDFEQIIRVEGLRDRQALGALHCVLVRPQRPPALIPNHRRFAQRFRQGQNAVIRRDEVHLRAAQGDVWPGRDPQLAVVLGFHCEPERRSDRPCLLAETIESGTAILILPRRGGVHGTSEAAQALAILSQLVIGQRPQFPPARHILELRKDAVRNGADAGLIVIWDDPNRTSPGLLRTPRVRAP